jgi:von Willebrand factor type A domain
MALQAELIHLVAEYMAISFQIPTVSGEDFQSSGLYAFFCVDKSGSMAGSPIRDTKGALISLVQKFQKVQVPITVYLFSNKLQELSSETDGYTNMLIEADNIKAAGGTLFSPVIEAMQLKIKEKHLKSVFAVWLTDGQDNKGLSSLIVLMDKFRDDMESNGISIAVHTIGFSPDHDAALLTKLSQSGTRPGSFQYVPPGGRIPVAVNNVYELAFVSTTWARIVSPSNTYKIEIEKDEEKLKGLVYISENDIEDCKVEVHRGENIEYYLLETYRGEAKDFKELVLLVTNFISSKIIQVLEIAGEKAAGQLRDIRPLIEEMDRRIESLIQEARKFRAFFRKQMQPYFSSTKDLLHQYYTTLRESVGPQLSNIQLASLNNLAHKNSLKRNLEKKIAREFGRNIDMLNESESKIEEIAKSLDKQELEIKYKGEIEKYGECILTTRNWLEALLDGDCFCVTFHLERPQNLLGDALEIKIKKINTTMITCDSFVDSALFETKAGQIIQGGRNYQHGEMPAVASSLVKGLPNETINGVLPVFINPDHWQVARLRIKQMIAWDITVDVLGYIPTQLYTFPYAILAKAIEDCDSEFLKFQCEIIKGTCLAVYGENKGSMSGFLRNLFEKFAESPSFRLPEFVPSISIFIGQLWTASVHGDINKPELIFPYLFEEEVRRRIETKKDISFQDFALKILDIDKNYYIEQARAAVLGTNSQYQNIFLGLKTQANITPTEKETRAPQSKLEFKFTDRIQTLSKRAETFIDKITKSIEKGGIIYKCIKLMELFGGVQYTSLESLGLITNEQKLALILQSYRDHKNSDRRDVINSGKYFNIFNPDEALVSVQEIYSGVITREALNYKSQLLADISSKHTSEKVLQFGASLDLDEAAGCLYGIKQGDTEFSKFYKQLYQPTSNLVAQKLKMLTHGEYLGIKLVMDSIKNNPNFVTWVPNKKVFNKIWVTHGSKASKEEWIDACPQKTERIEHKYLRQEGVFVPYSKPRNNVKDKRHWEGKVKSVSPANYKHPNKRGKRGKRGKK